MRFFSTLFASILGTLIALALVVLLGLLLFLGFAAASSQQPSVQSGSVLTMELSGSIPEQVSGDPFKQAFADEPAYDLRDVRVALQKAAADDRIEAVWLKPHGIQASWATLQEVRNALTTFRESGKPLYASGGEYFMSEGDYFLASAADSVFADPEAFFEFNGFNLDVAFLAGTLEKLGIEPVIFRAGTFKSAVEPLQREDLSPENRQQLTDLVEAQNAVFMNAIAKRRGQSADYWQSVAADSAFITAERARDAGLLDALLYEDQVRDQFKTRLGLETEDDLETVKLKDYTKISPGDAGLEVGTEGRIAVVYAVGSIMTGESADGTLGSTTFGESMKTAREDEDVDAVVVRVNSPGGSAVASDAMLREILLTKREKPVVVSMGDLAASGGYWISTPADTIVADPLTITGSIGVFFTFFNAEQFFDDKLGITFDGVQTSPYADLFSGVEPLSDGEEALLQRTVTDTYEGFLQRVADGRDMTTDEVDAIAQGRVWMGQQALDRGLVDVLGGLDDAIGIAAEMAGLEPDTYSVRTLPRPKTFFEELNEALGAQSARTVVRWMASPLERTLLERTDQLRDLAKMNGTVQARLPMELQLR
ncbi:MAG: signal peptide peptidase SppA [Bacteroidetes bacterium]|jgi:protease-4|nr:signal peptide peptidase SppA [Bacteroidota bacterium]